MGRHADGRVTGVESAKQRMEPHGSSQFHPMFGPRCKATRILKAARHLAIEHFLFALLLGAISFTPVVVRAQQEYSHKVLIVYDQSDRLTPISNFDVAFRSRMEQGSQATYFYREFLDNEIPGNDPGKNAKFVEAFRSWIAQNTPPTTWTWWSHSGTFLPNRCLACRRSMSASHPHRAEVPAGHSCRFCPVTRPQRPSNSPCV